ncbi:hypothetical protein ACSQ67_018620 [Phaseolus vulgaris]
MKAFAISPSLLNFKSFTFHHSYSSNPFFPLSSVLPSLSPSRLLHRPIPRHSPIMAAASFNSESARAPPAVPMPSPPLSKASSLSLSPSLRSRSLTARALLSFSSKLASVNSPSLPTKAGTSRTREPPFRTLHPRALILCFCLFYVPILRMSATVFCQEIWNSPYSNDSFPVYAEDIDAGADASPSTAMLSELSRLLKITIVGGSIPERSGGRLYNTCCVFGTDGKLLAKHRKIHLFDIDIPGKITFIESKTLTAGETPTIVDTEVGRIGIGICYDIRFPELAMIYAARGAHLLCYPGAFNMTTGPLHWELLQRARATDNQLYVATCSPARDTGSGYVAWGHSTLVGPFGEVLATTEHEEATIIAEIDYSILEQRRTNLPVTKQRRGDLYQLVDFQRLNSQ